MKSDTNQAPLALTIPGACAALAVKKSTLYELIKAGELEKCRIRGRTVVPMASIQALLERSRVNAATPAIGNQKPRGAGR